MVVIGKNFAASLCSKNDMLGVYKAIDDIFNTRYSYSGIFIDKDDRVLGVKTGSIKASLLGSFVMLENKDIYLLQSINNNCDNEQLIREFLSEYFCKTEKLKAEPSCFVLYDFRGANNG